MNLQQTRPGYISLSQADVFRHWGYKNLRSADPRLYTGRRYESADTNFRVEPLHIAPQTTVLTAVQPLPKRSFSTKQDMTGIGNDINSRQMVRLSVHVRHTPPFVRQLPICFWISGLYRNDNTDKATTKHLPLG